MSCCATTVAAGELPAAQRDAGMTHVLSVPSISCGKCIATIERALADLPGVTDARVNLTLKRVAVALGPAANIGQVVEALDRLGYPATPIDADDLSDVASTDAASRLLRALAVAGFAAANIMLLSVSVWSGADGATRDLFHLISAVIAVPAVAYAGQPFFRSAAAALRAHRLNMDVPISLAVLLALGMSLFETLNHGDQAFFDAAVTLLFFLLIGRYLDQRMRARARSAVVGLGHLAAKGAMRITASGDLAYVPSADIEPGMRLRLRPGDRAPVDARVVAGTGDVDRALVTGESAPVTVRPDNVIESGTLNVNGALDVIALRDAKTSFLAEVAGMLAAAERGRGDYVRVADRMARIYAPAVHLLALVAFAGWMVATAGDWQTSLYTAIAVLIVTCPCALGLAVPVVHVVGAARLFEAGILMKDGTALERLAAADRAVFDKTGTLTTGTPRVVAAPIDHPGVARALAAHSNHPAARAVDRFLAAHRPRRLDNAHEIPGAGVEAMVGAKRCRLGRADWVAEIATKPPQTDGLAFAVEGQPATAIRLAETLRAGAADAIADLAAQGLAPRILSGDHPAAVAAVARQLDVDVADAARTPADKIACIHQIHAAGHKVLMVGDGLNDAPSLAAGHVSMAPATAADVGRRAADFVFTRDSLAAVPFAKRIADRAARLVRQNFALAIAYNVIAVPSAMAGFVTPLVAAIAMSASSIVVVANAMRLRTGAKLDVSIPTMAMTAPVAAAP